MVGGPIFLSPMKAPSGRCGPSYVSVTQSQHQMLCRYQYTVDITQHCTSGSQPGSRHWQPESARWLSIIQPTPAVAALLADGSWAVAQWTLSQAFEEQGRGRGGSGCPTR